MRTPEVCRKTGVSFRMLDFWVRTGRVRPTIDARGSGSQREFDAEDVAVVEIQAALRRLGMPLLPDETARNISRANVPVVWIGPHGEWWEDAPPERLEAYVAVRVPGYRTIIDLTDEEFETSLAPVSVPA